MNEKLYPLGKKMTKLLLILMVLGLVVSFVGCGGDSPTGDGKGKLLVWTTNYDDGSVEEEYQYYLNPENNERVKDGSYNSYHSNGNYDFVGRYKEDNRDGEWIGYYESGKVRWESNYVDGKLEGKVFRYYESGGVKQELNYVDGKMHGKVVNYYESGGVEVEGNRVDGKHDGKWIW